MNPMIEMAAPAQDVFTPGVQRAARDFAQALAESPVFQAYETAVTQLDNDPAAQAAIHAFQERQQSLQALIMLNALSAEEQAEMARLQQAFMAEPAVVALLEAQDALTAVCQTTAAILSERIGLDFAAACAPGGCCG